MRGQDELFDRGSNMINTMRFHNDLDGGWTTGVFGSKGSGKTTLLLTLVQKSYCFNDKTKTNDHETVVWRARNTDYWNWFNKEYVCLHFHKNDNNPEYGRTVLFHTDKDKDMPIEDIPNIRYYSTCEELYKNLVRHKINAVYEPQDYFFREDLKRMIREKSLAKEDLFKGVTRMDPAIWWFEFFDFLVMHRTRREFMTVVLDEADDIIPPTPSGLRWHLNIWFRERLRDLRKWNISLILATHGTTDLDGTIFKKFMLMIYLPGCVAPANSLIRPRTRPLLLKKGLGYVEGSGMGYGMFSFDAIKQKPRVITEFIETEGLKLKLREIEENGKRKRGRPRKISPCVEERMQEKRVEINKALETMKEEDADFGLITEDVEGID